MNAPDVVLGEGVSIPHPDPVNLYGRRVGANTTIGRFVEIQKGALLGSNCKILSHSSSAKTSRSRRPRCSTRSMAALSKVGRH